MKNRAPGFLKQIITVLTSMVKSKTLAIKSKTNALRTRIIIFSLLRNRKFLMTTISQKLDSMLGQNEKYTKEDEDTNEEEQSNNNDIVLHNNKATSCEIENPTHTENIEEEEENQVYEYGYDEDVEKYPDLTHSLFDADDDDFEDPGGSVIDIVKNSKQNGEEFRLEDEIDHVADLFIKRFHRQMRIQKQHSLKRYQEMLERSA